MSDKMRVVVCGVVSRSVKYVSSSGQGLGSGRHTTVSFAILLELASFFGQVRPAAAVEDCAASSQSVVAYETPLIVSRRLEDAVADVTSFEYRPRITGDARNRVGDVTRQISPALIKTAL